MRRRHRRAVLLHQSVLRADDREVVGDGYAEAARSAMRAWHRAGLINAAETIYDGIDNALAAFDGCAMVMISDAHSSGWADGARSARCTIC
ncbi:MAG: hypothetical protein WC804_02300 [Sphingomonas sp.]